MQGTLNRNPQSTLDGPVKRSKTVTFDLAVLCNLMYVRFLCFFAAVPMNVTSAEVSASNSQFKRRLWTFNLSILWLRVLYVAGAIFLSLNVERFWNPFFLPLYIVLLACSAGAGCVGYSVLTCERGCFAEIWNFVLKYKSEVQSPKLLVLFMCNLVPSSCACVLGMSVLLAFNPQLVIQFRFAVYWALEAGLLTIGPTYWALVVISTAADIFSSFLFASLTCIAAISQMLFLEAWSSVMNQFLSSCKRRSSAIEAENVWLKLQELVVAIRVFNTGYSAAVFSFKLICLTISISSLTAMILLDFHGNLLFLAIMSYLSSSVTISYPALYHRAYGVSSGLHRAKRELLKFRQLDRRLQAISPKGVLVGSFNNFERESDLIYFDFIVKQVTSLILL